MTRLVRRSPTHVHTPNGDITCSPRAEKTPAELKRRGSVSGTGAKAPKIIDIYLSIDRQIRRHFLYL